MRHKGTQTHTDLSSTGDGGPAIHASCRSLDGLALDAQGNLYAVDGASGRITRSATNGAIGTLAGDGQRGFKGDGGPAASASLYGPNGIAADSLGNVYFADGMNRRVRSVWPNGIIATVAGNNRYRFFGDGGPAKSAVIDRPQAVVVD